MRSHLIGTPYTVKGLVTCVFEHPSCTAHLHLSQTKEVHHRYNPQSEINWDRRTLHNLNETRSPYLQMRHLKSLVVFQRRISVETIKSVFWGNVLKWRKFSDKTRKPGEHQHKAKTNLWLLKSWNMNYIASSTLKRQILSCFKSILVENDYEYTLVIGHGCCKRSLRAVRCPFRF